MTEPPSHYIDYPRYRELPYPIRQQLDDWLEREALINRHILSFELLEGAIRAADCAHDVDVICVGVDGCVQTTTIIFPVTSPPPREALT